MAIQTVKIADKNTLDEIKTILKDSGYGLEVIKELVDTWSSNNESVSTIQCTLGTTTSQSVYLLKDTKIYAAVELVPMSNCTFDTDHLVVTEDGVVEFSASSGDATVAIRIVY